MAATFRLQTSLLDWAASNLPAAVSAFKQSDDRSWRDRVLASIFRARADNQPGWLFSVVEEHGDQVLPLAGAIVRAAGYPVRGSFAEWIHDMRALSGTGPITSPEPRPVVVVETKPQQATQAKRKSEPQNTLFTSPA